MKKIVAILLCITVFTQIYFISNADSKEIKIYFNNSRLISDVSPIIKNGRTLVPIRALLEAFDATVSWDSESKTIICKKNYTSIKLVVGQKSACVGDVCSLLDTAPIIVNSRTLVPLRFISETFGFNVSWDEKTRSIFIESVIWDDNVKEIYGTEFEDEVLKSNSPVFVDIYADWCGPCKAISPIIDEIAQNMYKEIKFVKIDGDIESTKLEELGIEYEYFPTLRVYSKGRLILDISPSQDKDYLIKKIKEALSYL
jgi:thiol-disulfide isomerase/thioredoxin